MELDQTEKTVRRTDEENILKFGSLHELQNAIRILSGSFKGWIKGEKGPVLAISMGAQSAGLKQQTTDIYVEQIIGEMNQRFAKGQSWGGSIDSHNPSKPLNCNVLATPDKEGNVFYLDIYDQKNGPYHDLINELSRNLEVPTGYKGWSITCTYSAPKSLSIPLNDIEKVYTALGQDFDPDVFVESLAAL